MGTWWKIFSIIFLSCLILYFVNNFSNVFNLETENVVNKIDSILNSVSPFRAALSPVQEFVDSTFRGPTSENITSEDVSILEDVSENVILEDEFGKITPENIGDINDEQNLEFQEQPSIQDQIDDIFEKLDILSQEVEELAIQEEAEKKKIEDEEKTEDKKDEEVEKKDESEEVIIEEKEDPQKTNQSHQSIGHSSAPTPADLQPLQKLLIVEVQIAGDKSSYDFIEIYNPNPNAVYLKNYRLVKRAKTSSSDITIKSWFRDGEISIPAQRYYLWASSEDGYDFIIHADVSTSQAISDDNGIAIRFGNTNTGEIVDALGWGNFNNVLFEGALPLPPNLSKNKSLLRKKDINNLYIDTDNNQQDFITSNNPSPENSNNLITYFDPIPIETILDKASLPTNPTFSKEAEFIFSANKENSTFECSLDSLPFELCISPKKYSNLAAGLHNFQVFATDINDNIDETSEIFSWTIDEEPVVENPPEETPPEEPITEDNPTKISHILITEAQIEGDKSSNDFIEIYNPTDSDILLKNYRLVKRAKTSDSDTTIKSWSRDGEIAIPALSYYLWANSTDDYDDKVFAEFSTSQTISDNNGIAIRLGSENTGEIVDALGWGDNENLFEGTPFITTAENKNPGANQSIERKKDSDGSYIDTDDNSQDFLLQGTPNPKD